MHLILYHAGILPFKQIPTPQEILVQSHNEAQQTTGVTPHIMEALRDQ